MGTASESSVPLGTEQSTGVFRPVASLTHRVCPSIPGSNSSGSKSVPRLKEIATSECDERESFETHDSQFVCRNQAKVPIFLAPV